ncbi:uncharacterized mitochondrial protein-like protein [Tanacetum coccineum]
MPTEMELTLEQTQQGVSYEVSMEILLEPTSNKLMVGRSSRIRRKWTRMDFDIDNLTKSMNYKPVVAGNQSNGSAGTKSCYNASKARVETTKDYILLPFLTQDPLFSSSTKDSPDTGFKPSGEEEKKDVEALENEDSEVLNVKEPRVNQEKDENFNNTKHINTVSSTVNTASIEDNDVDENIVYGCADDQNMPNLEEIDYSNDDEGVGVEADMNNLDTFMLVSPIPTTRIHKDHPVEHIIRDIHLARQTRRMTKSVTEHGYTQEEGIDYDEDFAPVARIETIRLFLAYASFKDFVVYQMDVKSAFIYDKIEEEVYVCQPPRAWYETLSTYLLDNGFQRGQIDKTLFIKRVKSDILLVQDIPHRSMIGSLMYLTSSRPDIMFDVCACARFQVTPKVSHLHVVKRIFRYLKGQPKLGLWYLKDSPFVLEAYTDTDYAGASLDRKSITGGCQFLGRRLISWQCKKQTVVANSTTKAEYVATSNCYGQVKTGNSKVNAAVHYLVLLGKTQFHHRLQQLSSMKALKFVDSHNMIAYLEKSMKNADFDKIVDFLTASPIRYSLTVFANMRRQGKAFLRTVTPLFPSMLASQAVDSEGSGQLSEPQHTPTTASPSHSSGPTTLIADETVYEERGDSVERAATTAASLDAEQDSGNIIRTQSMTTRNEPIPQGTGSDIDIVAKGFLPIKPAQNFGTLFQSRTKRSLLAEKICGLRRMHHNRCARNEFDQEHKRTHHVSFNEDVKTQGRHPVTTELVYCEPDKPVKVKGIDQIAFDEEVAQRLEAQMQAEYEEEERSQLKNNGFKIRIVHLSNSIKWVDSFVPMDSEVVEGSKSRVPLTPHLPHSPGPTPPTQKGSKKRTRKELDEESVKRQKLKDDAEKAKLKACLEIVPGDGVVTIESLATRII